jgi:DNA polymerase-4
MYTLRVPSLVRRILHIDMDAFFASIEQRDDPFLRGKPVAVGGDPASRGVVAASSYEARTFGVRSAMSMAKAVRLCPPLIIVPPDFHKYHGVSEQIFSIVREVTPLVEPLSLDEAYLDVTENAWGEPLAVNVARRIKQRIRNESGLTASAGVAPNKFLAKIASGWQKPDGLTVIPPERVETFLAQLPIEALWGVGPVTAGKLKAGGIVRLLDIREVHPDRLHLLVGSLADWLRLLSYGIDDRPVEPDRPAKSSSSERTYAADLVDVAKMRAEVERMAREAAAWLERQGLFARTVTVKVRFADFTTVTRSHSRRPSTRDADDVTRRTLILLERTEASVRPVRLLGVGVHNLSESDREDAPDGPASGLLPFDGDD